MGGRDGEGADGGGGEFAGGGQDRDGRRAPESGGGVQAADVEAVAHDDPSAEEPDAGHHVGGDAGRAAGVVHRDGVQHEQGGSGGDQGVGAKPRHPGPLLAFDADHRAAADAGRKPGAEVQRGQGVHVAHPRGVVPGQPLCRRSI